MTWRILLITLSFAGLLSCQKSSTDRVATVASVPQQENLDGSAQAENNDNELLALHRDIPQKSPLEPAKLTGLKKMPDCGLWIFLKGTDVIDSNDLAKLLAEQNFQQMPDRMHYWDFGDYSFEAEDYHPQGKVHYMRQRGDSKGGSAIMGRVKALGDVGEITIADIEEELQIPGQLDLSRQEYIITTSRGDSITFVVNAEGKILDTGSDARAYFDAQCKP